MAYMSSCVLFFAASSIPLWSGGSWAGIREEGCWDWCRERRGSWSVRKREMRTRLGEMRAQNNEPQQSPSPCLRETQGCLPPSTVLAV